ncbi:MAG: hypothetical protein ACR2HH_00875 [Chthoniobacterales bacterium]
MQDALTRTWAIVRADFLIRFRRVSTLIVFLLLSAFAYVWVPAPATGRTLIQIDGQRALYNSGAIGLGTASLAMMFVGLFGYYVISNAIRRDVVSRCGLIAASTPMRSREYLLGKFFGNLAFLATFVAGFMLSSMAMLLVRGEAPLEPIVFVRQYLLLTPAAIVFVSAVAVLFESVPFLSGKIGDVFYFFFWMIFVGLAVGNQVSGGRINWARAFDFSGFGFMIDQMTHTLHTNELSIGASAFDPAKPPIWFPGLTMTADWILPRLCSLVIPLLFLPVAGFFFHRFDPVATRATSERASRNWLGRIQNLFKPVGRRVVAILMKPLRGQSFATAVWADAVLTITLLPLVSLVFLAFAAAALFAPSPAEILPIIFAVLAIIISDVATRDLRAGTLANLYAAPRLREGFVCWKFCSAFLLSLLLCLPVLVRAGGRGGHALSMLGVGLFFVTASATALGTLSRNPKTFIVGFLSFWYLAINDKGASPLLDFAGFNGVATAKTLMLYVALGVAGLLSAHLFQRARLSA